MNKKCFLAVCVIICYFTIWYACPLNNYYNLINFIDDWNNHTQAPYRIEHEGVSIKRCIFSSPLVSHVSIHKMKLVFKNNQNTIQGEEETEVVCWYFDQNKQHLSFDL